MTAVTYSARAVAALVVRKGIKCDAKRVRAWARDHIARLDDEGYTTHQYSGPERDRIVNALVARSRARATGDDARASSASRGRKAPTKAPTKATKAPVSAPSAPSAPKGTDAA